LPAALTKKVVGFPEKSAVVIIVYVDDDPSHGADHATTLFAQGSRFKVAISTMQLAERMRHPHR